MDEEKVEYFMYLFGIISISAVLGFTITLLDLLGFSPLRWTDRMVLCIYFVSILCLAVLGLYFLKKEKRGEKSE